MSLNDIILNIGCETNDEDIEQLMRETEQHPYFHAAALALTSALYKRRSSNYGDVIRRTAISIPDRKALFALIEGSEYKIAPSQTTSSQRESIFQKSESADRTTSLIDHFLVNIPEEKTRKLTKADAATDYMSYLLQNGGGGNDDNNQARQQPMRRQDLIDDFIGNNAEGGRIHLPEEETTEHEIQTNEIIDDDEVAPEYFTETMARIYIKQGKFEKASKIISRLNTKYPKKNRYFADQMRFLEKLMLNERAAKV